MRRSMLAAAACLALIVFATACSSVQVTRVGADTSVDLSGNWDDTDARIVCQSLLNKLFAAPSIASLIDEFSAKNNGGKPTVIVGRFRNMSSEHINTDILSGMMRAAIINSGKLRFVEGGDAREELRAERYDQLANASENSAPAVGNETAANFMLTGEVTSMIDRAKNRTVRAYFVKATLKNIETNDVVWEDNCNDIKKVIVQPKAKF